VKCLKKFISITWKETLNEKKDEAMKLNERSIKMTYYDNKLFEAIWFGNVQVQENEYFLTSQ